MTDVLNSWLTGNLSSEARIWSAAAPALFIFAYLLGGLMLYVGISLLRGPLHDREMSERGSSVLIGMAARHYFVWIMRPMWWLLRRTDIPAVALTTLSVLLASAAAVAMACGRFGLGGWLYVSSGLCDFFDGRIARATGSAGPSGAALDSVLDRYSDLVVLIGLGWYYRDTWVLLAIGALIIGTALVPYVRARGGSLGVDVKVGLMQRPERMLYLGLAVALSPILEAIYAPAATHPMHVLAVVGICLIAGSTLITAVQRAAHLIRALDSGDRQRYASWMSAERGSLVRFGISSAIATLADFVAVVALVDQGLPATAATFLGCGIGACVNFTINRFWAFDHNNEAFIGQMWRYGFASGTGALLNAGGVAVLLLLPSLDYRIAWTITRAAVWLFWNYPLNRNYVFAKAPGVPSAADATAEDPSRHRQPPRLRHQQ